MRIPSRFGRRSPILYLAGLLLLLDLMPVSAAHEAAGALSEGAISRYVSLRADDTASPPPSANQRHQSFGAKFPPLHRYFGYGAILLGTAAAASGSDDDLHHAAGVTAGILGVGAFVTGILENRSYVNFDDGISRYNTHAVLGGLAMAGFVAAAAIANSTEAHAGFGTSATIAVAVTIPLLRW